MEGEEYSADLTRRSSDFTRVLFAQRYQVQGVPKTVVNEQVEFVGALPEPRFVQEVLKALHEQKK
jgi:predicted DsbA family dithiol-disulfide isomerase